MSNLKKYLFFISRIFIGVVFIYSGFVKGIDPLGYTYKITDYFFAFGMKWATPLAFSLSLFISISEFVVGASILLNLKIKLSTLGALIFMIIFTPLTLILALTNPVTDCGCFGDAIILTNWQTFWKNIILIIPTIYLFTNRKKYKNAITNTEQWIIIAFISLFMLLTSIYCYKHLPIIDFRPYKTGTYIQDKMTIPEGAPTDQWESTFIYSKNGKEQKFGINDLPDSTWTFVDAKHSIIKKGYEPPIHDFNIVDNNGVDFTDMILTDDKYNFLLISYDITKADYNNFEKINELYEYCQQMDYPFYALTSSTDKDIKTYKEKTNAQYKFYTTDEITLKTIVRSNPGLIIIKDGTIINKWHINDFPLPNEIHQNITHQSLKEYKNQSEKYLSLLLIFIGLSVTLAYINIRKKITTK